MKQWSASIYFGDIFRPTKVTRGYFLPHRWLKNKQSIYDELSETHWTLIVSDEVSDHVLQNGLSTDHAINIMKLPKDTYPVKFILIRPDWHIAYTSNEFSKDVLKHFF